VTGSGAVGERITHPTAIPSYLRDIPLAKTRDGAYHPKSGVGHHPDHNRHDTAEAARSRGRGDSLSELTAAIDALRAKGTITRPGKPFVIGNYEGQTSIEAKLPGVQVSYSPSNGDLTAKLGNKTLYSIHLDAILRNAEQLGKVLNSLGQGVVRLPDGLTVTFAFSFSNGISVTMSRGGVDTEVTFKPDQQIEISALVTEHVSKIGEPVDLLISTTLTPITSGFRRQPTSPHAPQHVPYPVPVPSFPSIAGPEIEAEAPELVADLGTGVGAEAAVGAAEYIVELLGA
jgi:hypothetical protein